MLDRIKRLRHFSVRNTYRSATSSQKYQRGISFIQRKPFTAFFLTLGLLLLIMIGGSAINSLNKKEVTREIPVKGVSTFNIGETPTVKLQAQIEKKGVITIVAQAPGVVDTIHVEEGATLKAGQKIVSLSTNYQGGNAAALQTQLAGAQARNANETYSTQKELIKKQREVAEKSNTNAEELRRISRDSAGDTRELLDLNEDILGRLDDALEQAENSGDEAAIAAAQQAIAPVQAGVVQLRGTLRNLEYQGNNETPATELSNLQKDIALKQLDVQEKAIDLGRQVAGIQYNLALVQEGLMHPSAPYPAVVERVFVQKGQVVNPGTPIAIVRCLDIATSAVLRAPRDIALSISRVEPTTFTINRQQVRVVPSYVSTIATDGQLHTILYNLPEGASNSTNLEFVPVEVPVILSRSATTIPYIPIDAVFQSQEESTVNIVDGGKVTSRTVELGTVYGSFVEVLSGLNRGDKVILNRNVVVGDKVRLE